MNESFQQAQAQKALEDGKGEIKAVAKAFGLTPFEAREAILLYSAFTGKNIDKIARLQLDEFPNACDFEENRKGEKSNEHY